MAQPHRDSRNSNKPAIATDSRTGRDDDHTPTNDGQSRLQRPYLHGSTASEDTIKATPTPPMEIPFAQDEYSEFDAPSQDRRHESFMDHYMRTRKPSISFDNEITIESGKRQSIEEPLQTPERRSRGRSLAQMLNDDRHTRAHSESDRSQYDPMTGRHLPKFSSSPPREAAKVGEARFPLLQTTVDEMARESQTHLPPTSSLTTESTISPTTDEVYTPVNERNNFITSPITMSPSMPCFSSSYELSRSGHRKASQRWRDGEAAPDFFGRAGSIRKGMRDSTRRTPRRETTSSAKSPNSVASSFLKGFSLGSGSDEPGGPLAVDAEGQTIGEDYVLGKQIGFGGFSTVKEVTQLSADTGKQRKLAVKIVRRQIDGKSETENDAAQSEFEHEIELWRLLNHRHLLPLEAVYKLDEATFCFIPLSVGGTLFDLVRSNRSGLQPDLACNYTFQLASALRYLHLDARVVHRDVKLENCLLDTSCGEPGLVRLCDFGMAEWISSDNDGDSGESLKPTNSISSEELAERRLHKFFGPADTSTSAFAGGSLEYAAPEILRLATHSNIDFNHDATPPGRSLVLPSVDIWAMGVCIFSMLMGKRPFSDNFQPRVVMAILAGDWDRKGLRDKSGSDAMEVVTACLQMDPRQRPGVLEIINKQWFDLVRDLFEDRDEDDENGDGDASKGGWRL